MDVAALAMDVATLAQSVGESPIRIRLLPAVYATAATGRPLRDRELANSLTDLVRSKMQQARPVSVVDVDGPA
ncbi:MAG: hypothetical protein ACYC6N_26550 [Pirellulaceae bacterium]